VFRLISTDSGPSWQVVPGSLSSIAVGELGVWGVNARGQVFQYDPTSQEQGKWLARPGTLSRLAVGTSAIWGVSPNHQALLLPDGNPEAEWQEIAAHVTDISVAGQLVCCVDDDGRLAYTFDATKWDHLDDGQPHHFVRCSTNGWSIWALDDEAGIWLWVE
jgi:hypothetical protein